MKARPFELGLHPHSGIATLTYVAERESAMSTRTVSKGTLPAGGVEWMQAGRGIWHGGGLGKAARTRGFQLWIALQPELELGPTISIYQAPEDVRQDGPARVLLGSYGPASSAIVSPSRSTISGTPQARRALAVRAPTGHTVLWTAIASRVFVRYLTNFSQGNSWHSSRRARRSNLKR